ncbi:MAG: protein kinase domain-containing protein [Acidobacteriota bacterium]
MTDERWERVKAIFQAAVELPAAERDAFLTSEIGHDIELRREVESLLASDAHDVSVLGGLKVAAAALLAEGPQIAHLPVGGTEPAAPILQVHHRIGTYEIIGPLGAGAMGEVYHARDTKLNRDVALKLLPPQFAAESGRLARFKREAQLLAALNHPNIASIYGFEDSGGLPALVLELVDGPTLAERVARGPLPLQEALVIARQIADALEAAHEKDIIHRDLKPANIKIDDSGTVKVLDFGLAKSARPDSRPDLSRDGVILGTASYMSPEQARGQSVDKRADIWAFGCVLYEMLTGRLAFPGDTVSDTIAKVLEREPDWTHLPPATPSSIRRVLFRCLVKNPKQRMRDIGDVKMEIDALDDMLPGVVATPLARFAKLRTTWLPWFAVTAFAVSVGIWEVSRSPGTVQNALANATFTPLTNWTGNEEGAEISPNGELVAFLSDRDGEFDLWVSQVGTGFFHNLTRDMPPLVGSGFIVRKLGFSADSSQIWFNPGDGKPPMLIPWMGGTPRPFLASGTNTPAGSSDGKRLVYVDKAHRDDPIYLADGSGADGRQIFAPGPLKNMNPVWSPDSKWIYFSRGSEPQDESEMDVWRLRPSGGSPQRVTTQHLAINFLAPLDARRMLFVARAEDRSGPWLWSLDVERGVSTRVPSGVDQYMSVSASRDGRRVVATVANPSASLWRVPLLDRIVEERDAEPFPVPVPTGLAFAPRFGKDSLFYLSDRGTADGLWKIQNGQSSQVRRGADGALSEPPAISVHDRLAVVIRKEGKRYLSVMSADGTDAQTVARSIQIEGAAGQGAVDWSPDGARIVAGGRDGKGPSLFIIPVDTGVPVRLLEGTWVNPVWSPRGDLIVYAGRSVIGQVELRGVRPDGTPVPLPQVLVRPGGYRFLPDGSGLVYVERIQSLDFWLLDLATGKRRQLTRLDNQGALRTFDITPDGKSIVFDRSRQNSNVVLIEVPESVP